MAAMVLEAILQYERFYALFIHLKNTLTYVAGRSPCYYTKVEMTQEDCKWCKYFASICPFLLTSI